MADTKTQFDYLLNALERASQSDKPAENGYAEKRRALFAYVRGLESALQQQETRETALRMAGAAGAVPDPDVVGAPAVGASGSDWECVGAFRFNNYGGWQQLAKEYEEDPDATKLYRKRTAGVGEREFNAALDVLRKQGVARGVEVRCQQEESPEDADGGGR